jgi:phytoene/squalene synthetase
MLLWLQTRRPVLLWRGLRARRDTPDLDGLGRETDPERFLWSILPHAARSFAASIVALPRAKARAAAVAYLYCRMLDTYEDLYPDDAGRVGELRRFAGRFATEPPQRPTPIPATRARDERDRLHLLLVERYGLVDQVYDRLPDDQRAAIADLVRSMAEGMAWSAEAFARQGGLLTDRSQLQRYCHNVIGYPALFVLRLLDEREPADWERKAALEVSEMVQLANVSRDVERDLERGIAYHPALEPFLKGAGAEPQRAAAVLRAREEIIELALGRVPAYVRLFEDSLAKRSPAARAAAVMMLSFTDLHYRGCMRQAGHRPWRGPRGPFSIVVRASPALVSSRAARARITGIEARFLAAAKRLAAKRSVRSAG